MFDPSDIETRYALEDGMAYMASIFTEPTDEDLAQIEAIQGLMDSLPPREADFVDLYYFKRKKQTEIAYIFGCSQPTVCYRLQRATSRIQFLLQLPQVAEEDLLRDMGLFLPDPQDVRIMHLMWRTTCQSEAAKELGVSQGLVRHRFLRTIKRMKQFIQTEDLREDLQELEFELSSAVVPSDRVDVNTRMEAVRDKIHAGMKYIPSGVRIGPKQFGVYVQLFEFIYANKNILREVSRPAWDARCDRRIDALPGKQPAP